MDLTKSLHRLAVALLTLVMLVIFNADAAGRTLAGVAFEEQLHLDGTPLLLNGAGVRSKFFIKAYTIGLYLPRKVGDAKLAINQPGPKRLRIVALRDVGVSMFLSGLNNSLEKNCARSDLTALQPRLDQFNAAIKSIGQIPEGEAFTIDLTADNQTRLNLNGKQVGQNIAGVDFYQALLHVWLGEKPAQEELKAALLGL